MAVEALAKKLIEDRCADAELLRLTDRVMRRVLMDIDVAWVCWDWYILQTLLGGDYDAYDTWARKNCEDE